MAADEEGRAFLVGPPVEALREWLQRADITKGSVFRAIDGWGAVEDRALTPQSINLIVKRSCAMAGLDPRDYSAHRLRGGVSHRSGAAGGCAAGGDAAVAAPFGAAGGELLQRGRPGEGRAVRLGK